MLLMTNARVGLYDEVAVGPASTVDGELLAHLDDVPAGAWLAVVVESVDRSALTALDLLAYQRACARLPAWTAAQQTAAVCASYVFSVGPGSTIQATRCDIDHAIAHPVGPTQIGNLIPLDRPNHGHKTRRSLSVTVGDSDTVFLTTRLGQTRTVTPYDHRMTDDD